MECNTGIFYFFLNSPLSWLFGAISYCLANSNDSTYFTPVEYVNLNQGDIQ